MRSTRSLLAASTVLLAAASAGATELVVNGDFEDPTLGAGWTQVGSFDLILAASEIPSELTSITTNFVWMGGYENAADSLSQVIDFGSSAPVGATALLTFDTVVFVADETTYDFFSVSVGGTTLATYDLGDDTSQGYLTDLATLSFDVTSFLGTGAQSLTFTLTTDISLNSSVFLDNISIQVSAVPEPSTYALGLGGLVLGAALLARRRSRRHS